MTTAQATAPVQSSATTAKKTGSFDWRRFVPRTFLHAAIIALIILWILPTFGLFVSSFRHASDISSTGWWTIFRTPLDFTKYTLENYDAVINNPNYDMGQAFLNSLIIAIPATI